MERPLACYEPVSVNLPGNVTDTDEIGSPFFDDHLEILKRFSPITVRRNRQPAPTPPAPVSPFTPIVPIMTTYQLTALPLSFADHSPGTATPRLYDCCRASTMRYPGIGQPLIRSYHIPSTSAASQ
jgi:hypothetical protein